MKEQIIIALSTLSGALIGGVFVLLASWQDKKWNAMEKDLKCLCNQVKSYYNLEKLYSIELAKIANKKQQTILKQMRNTLVKGGSYERPVLTENNVNSIISKWRLF